MKLVVCKECESPDIEQLEWRLVNTGDFSGYMGEQGPPEQWCRNCEEHVSFKEKIIINSKYPMKDMKEKTRG